MALVNALMRLIPMAIAYGSLLFTGSLHIEDEIKQGLIWHEMTGFSSLKYLPSIISIIISIICYRFIIKALRNKLPELFATKGYFAYVVIIISLVAFPILNLLDEYFRINWG
ncbi:MAG: hypothetical protein RDV00_04635 [Clostridia bacterium]|nr:hypothetical protein [Clostridia bacterium]